MFDVFCLLLLWNNEYLLKITGGLKCSLSLNGRSVESNSISFMFEVQNCLLKAIIRHLLIRSNSKKWFDFEP